MTLCSNDKLNKIPHANPFTAEVFAEIHDNE